MAAMSTYQVRVTREGPWLVAEVPGVGVTQGSTLLEAQAMAVDLIATMTGEEESLIAVDLHMVRDADPTLSQTQRPIAFDALAD